LSKEKPILFSTPMVQAIQKLIKTMTRRLNGLKEINKNPDQWSLDAEEYSPNGYVVTFVNSNTKQYLNIKCPREVGDILWVRETWQEVYNPEHETKHTPITDLISNWDDIPKTKFTDNTGWNTEAFYVYKASDIKYVVDNFLLWRPSIFMPRTAARLFLKVTNIRVERLQDITDEDCEAEGVRPSVDGDARDWRESENGWHRTYRQLWDSLNKTRGYGWDLNPWVWVIEFERVEA